MLFMCPRCRARHTIPPQTQRDEKRAALVTQLLGEEGILSDEPAPAGEAGESSLAIQARMLVYKNTSKLGVQGAAREIIRRSMRFIGKWMDAPNFQNEAGGAFPWHD
eukprot:8603022-Alexandrium_andersonii.AAC.1